MFLQEVSCGDWLVILVIWELILYAWPSSILYGFYCCWLELQVSDIFSDSPFRVFADALKSGGIIKMLCVPSGAKSYSNTALKKGDIYNEANKSGAKGLPFLKVLDDGKWVSFFFFVLLLFCFCWGEGGDRWIGIYISWWTVILVPPLTVSMFPFRGSWGNFCFSIKFGSYK